MPSPSTLQIRVHERLALLLGDLENDPAVAHGQAAVSTQARKAGLVSKTELLTRLLEQALLARRYARHYLPPGGAMAEPGIPEIDDGGRTRTPWPTHRGHDGVTFRLVETEGFEPRFPDEDENLDVIAVAEAAQGVTR